MTRVFRKNFAAYIEMSPEDVGRIDAMIAAIQNQLNLSRWDAIATMFIWGFEIAMEKLKDEVLRESVRRVLVNRKLADALDRERRHNKRIYEAVRELGYEQAMKIASAEGLSTEDADRAIKGAKPRDGEAPAGDLAREWLRELLEDGAEMNVKEIKELAVRDGWLPEDGAIGYDDAYKRGWGMLRQAAMKLGVSGGDKRGVWQRMLH